MIPGPPSHHLDDLMLPRPTTASPDAYCGTASPDTPPPPPPPPPEEIVKAARLAPDHRISAIDPGWHGEGVPPDFAVVGRWRSGAGGEIEGWEDNDAYRPSRPSPQALDWPEPTDVVDAARQLAVTGHGPPEDVATRWPTRRSRCSLPDGSPVTATATEARLWSPSSPPPSTPTSSAASPSRAGPRPTC